MVYPGTSEYEKEREKSEFERREELRRAADEKTKEKPGDPPRDTTIPEGPAYNP